MAFSTIPHCKCHVHNSMGDEGHMYPTTFEAIGGLIIIMYPAQNVDQYLLKGNQQAGAELGQAQLKLGLYFTLIFCRFVPIVLVGLT